MTDTFITFLNEKRDRFRKQIQKLEDEIADLDKSEKLYRASMAAAPETLPKPPVKTVPLSQVLNDVSNIVTTLKYNIKPTHTIKERVLAILERHPDGLTSGQLLRALNATGLPDLQRVSLSPQLSRLKQSDILEANEGLWRLTNKNEGDDNVESLA